jgi:hypothetical protein
LIGGKSNFTGGNFTLNGGNSALAVSQCAFNSYKEKSLCQRQTTGSPSDPANKGYRIWYSVITQDAASTGASPSTNPSELNESFYSKRKKDVIEFAFDDSGKTAYFAVQIENEGRKGPWGPLTAALIP